MPTFTDRRMQQFFNAQPGATPKDSVDWFRKNVRKTYVSPERIMGEDKNAKLGWQSVGVGKMYLAQYSAKWYEEIKTLPYYDRFPVIIPIGSKINKDGTKKPGSFLALNMHYLPPVLRANLLSALFETENNAQFNDTKKMQINYGILLKASKFKEFKPCIKEYLKERWRSPFMRIEYPEWPLVAMLPIEMFRGASKQEVWSDSRKLIR